MSNSFRLFSDVWQSGCKAFYNGLSQKSKDEINRHIHLFYFIWACRDIVAVYLYSMLCAQIVKQCVCVCVYD